MSIAAAAPTRAKLSTITPIKDYRLISLTVTFEPLPGFRQGPEQTMADDDGTVFIRHHIGCTELACDFAGAA